MKPLYITAFLTLYCTFLFGQSSNEFFNHLKSFKGKTIYGKAIYMPDTTKANDFWGKELSFTVLQFKRSELRLPFNAGENKTRTWILKKSRHGIQLKHDHRHADGSQDSITNYGGDSDISLGTTLSQYFPADAFTAKLLPSASTNRWIMEFSADKKRFYYILERNKSLRFKAEFYLEN
ncbi:hypothetical protein [Daejeonella sp. H1SJ63]|uniref:hypothetical protein n=1 Tax=Daejeonella sp. H1SJ63 TaxID=3034145 RepID=UPI0023EDFC9F|nr:hypothetical protein [Daejeonella sp. H1SJ63]